MIILVRSYFHKSRGQTVSMLLIIFAAAALMNIGALTLNNYGILFDEKIKEFNAPDLSLIVGKEDYRPSYEDFLKSDLMVRQTSTEDILFLPESSFLFGGGKLIMSVVIQNAGLSREISPLMLVGEREDISANSIYAPYIMQLGGGYQLGDTFTFEYKHLEYSFRIAGFFEDIVFGGTNTGAIGFYMPEPVYKKFMAESFAVPAVLLSAILTDQQYGTDVLEGFSAYYSEDQNIFWGMDISLTKQARTISVNIVSMIIVAFAIIIALVAIIVIRFRINDSIQDDIKDFGALKALGYTGRQIKASIMVQFLCTAFIGSVLGIAASYLLIPLLSTIFSAQTGLLWNQGFALSTSAACLLIILLTVVVDVLYSSRRIKNLNPIVAIRGDTSARGFKRGFFQLDKSRGNLQLLLAGKHMIQNLGQNIVIVIIVAGVTFASAFGLMLYYNIDSKSDAFLKTIAGELFSVGVIPLSNSHTSRLNEEIGKLSGVRKSITFDDVRVIIDDVSCYASVTEDFDEVEGGMLYEGSYPKTSDEVALGGMLCEKLGKEIGDTISISRGNYTEDYTICGMVQSGNNVGRILAMDVEGIRRISPEYLQSFIYIYLEEGEDADAFIRMLEDRYGSVINAPINMDDIVVGSTGSYVAIILIVSVIILIITGAVVALILYFVIITTIVRRKRVFGVQKALGFTTFQLVQQIALSFLPVVVTGVALGIIMGYLGINPLLSALFKSIGVMKFEMAMANHLFAILCVGIAVFSYVIAVAVSYRLRRISAYALVTE